MTATAQQVRTYIRPNIRDRMLALLEEHKLSPRELAVFNAIWERTASNQAFDRITNRQICETEQFLRCHPKWEADKNYPPTASTRRQVFQIVRDLRLKGVCILGDRAGFWIPHFDNEVQEFIANAESKARATLTGYNEMVNGLANYLPSNVTPTLFS